MSYLPVIIIGAPRSGTNLLRDLLTALPGVGTWPCDEINYIWRHGNLRYPSDAFTTGMATDPIAAYIRGRFEALANRRGLEVLVEKTCANSLRVGFVDRVVPAAKYLYIVRDGLDAVASAMQRWKARLDIPYLARKARYVPGSDLPYYAWRYLGNRVHRLISRERRLAFWGPRLDNMDALLARHSLAEVCALQWQAWVDLAEQGFADMDRTRVLRLRYEDFVRSPRAEFSRIARELGREVPTDFALQHLSRVSPDSVGKGRAALGQAKVKSLLPLVGETLERHGYRL